MDSAPDTPRSAGPDGTGRYRFDMTAASLNGSRGARRPAERQVAMVRLLLILVGVGLVGLFGYAFFG